MFPHGVGVAPSTEPTLRRACGDRRGARRRTVSGVGHFGVLLALKRHLVLAQLVAVHPAVCADPEERTTCHSRNQS